MVRKNELYSLMHVVLVSDSETRKKKCIGWCSYSRVHRLLYFFWMYLLLT